MNHTLSSRTQTISKGRVTSNLKKPKNEGNFGNNVDYNNNKTANNHQFKNYNNPQYTNAGGNNKSVDFKNENAINNQFIQYGKFAGNNQITTSTDNVFRITTTQNDLSLNNSDIMQHRNQFENYGPVSATDTKVITTKTRIGSQILNVNEINKNDKSIKKYNNPSPNRFNNPTTLKKTTFLNKNLTKERINTPTKRETNKTYTNTTVTNSNLYNDKNKIMNNKPANLNQKVQDKTQTLNANKKFKITNADNIIHEYKNTLKNNKFYINTEKEDSNKNALSPTYTKQKLNILGNKISRENPNANLKINSSPNRIFDDNNQNKRILLHETLQIKKEVLTKKILGNKNDLNSSFQHHNERFNMNQTVKTGNFLNNKSNELKTKNTSKSIDRNDPQFNSNKLIQANLKTSHQDNRNNKSPNNQQTNINKPINNKNINLNSKQENQNTVSNDYSNEKENISNNNDALINNNANRQKHIQNHAETSNAKNVFSMNAENLKSKNAKGHENMEHDSMEIDERLKEIKMSQLNESKFPPENLILNPLKNKEKENILNEINSYLDRNEKIINNKSSKNFGDTPNYSNKQLINAKNLKADPTIGNVNNLNNTNQQNILSSKEGAAANLMMNNSMVENNNVNNSVFLNTNRTVNKKNPNLNQAEININDRNSSSMVENNFINPNNISVNLDLNSKKNFNNIGVTNNAQTLDNSTYIIKDGKLYNNNALNKSVISVTEEMNKSLFEKKSNANNLLGLNNSFKNNLYQSVSNKPENDLNREKLILDKINLEIQKNEFRMTQESAKLNNPTLKKEEEIYLKSELKKLTNKIDILKKEKEMQERLIKEAEAMLILKFELELKEKFKNEKNSKFNTLTNNQLNNSMFNNFNFQSTSNNNPNNLQINNLNLSIHGTPGKLDKYNNLININNSAEDFRNKNVSRINEKLLIPSNNIEINISNTNNNKKEISFYNAENNKSKPNPEGKLLDELRYKNEERERLMHFENLEKEMLIEKFNRKNNEVEKLEKEKQQREKFEMQKLLDAKEKERISNEKKEAERLQNERMEKDKKDNEIKEKALIDKLESEKIAELMRKLEEEKQHRLMFEEKVKKLEADKKQKENQNNLQPINPTLDNLQEMETKIMKNSEIINQEINNSLSQRNSGNNNNLAGKNSFVFDLLENKGNLNKNVKKKGEMNLNNSNTNNSILNESKDKIKIIIKVNEQNHNNNHIVNKPINNSFIKTNQINERKSSIYNNLNNSYRDRENSKDSKDQPRKSLDDIKISNSLLDKNSKEPSNWRKSDPSVIQNNFAKNFINVNHIFGRGNNAEKSNNKDGSRNNSLSKTQIDDVDIHKNNNLNKNEDKDSRKVSSLNSSILSEIDTTNKEKYNFKSFIFANKSGDSVEKSNGNNHKNIKSFEPKVKPEGNASINLSNIEEKNNKNNEKAEENLKQNKIQKENKNESKPVPSENQKEKTIERAIKDNNKELPSVAIKVKESPRNSQSPDKKESTSEINTPDNSCFVNPKAGEKYVIVDVNESDEEDELDDQKFQLYQDYVKKMKDMASETKDIENNMRQFTNIIKNIVTSNNIQAQNA